MKKSIASAVIAVLMILALIPVYVSAGWDGVSTAMPSGSGTEADPYVIKTENELAGLAKTVNDGDALEGKYVVLDADLDLGGNPWTPIGETKAFMGLFDGRGHTISNIKVETTANNAGLFGIVKDGHVENLNVENVSVKGPKYAGGIVALGQVSAGFGDTTFRNLHVKDVSMEAEQAGGVIGRVSTSNAFVGQILIEYCSADGVSYNLVTPEGASAKAQMFVGGIVAAAGSSIVCYCWAENVEVLAGGNHSGHVSIGGIVGIQGANSAGCYVENCYAIGVKGTVAEGTSTPNEKIGLGGIIGRAGNTLADHEVQNCYALNTEFKIPEGYEGAGGVIGHANNFVSYNNCFTDAAKGIGFDNMMSDYPITVGVNAGELGAAGAAEKMQLNLNNSNKVWIDDIKAGHPVIDVNAIAGNKFTAKDWNAPDPTEPSATVPSEPEKTTGESPATDAPKATDAPVITAAPPEEKPAGKKGCGSSAVCGLCIAAILGTAAIIRKKR